MEDKIIIKVRMPKSMWDRLVEKHPEIKDMPKSQAITHLLSKLL